jgi:GT2 family glycosyltransferase
MKSVPKICAVILNTNRREDTLECLQSLINNQYPNLHIIILDNASTDGSYEAIQTTYPQVQQVSLTENKGYAGNNNAGIALAMEAQADWIFVLNEDIILAPDALSQLMTVVQELPQVGIIGPLVYHHNEPTIIQSAGGILSARWDSSHLGLNETDHGQYNQPQEVQWISGCAIGVRRLAIEQAGMIDERFFYYWEETEWCLRIRSFGWQALVIPQAKIWHKGVQRDYQPNPNVTYYSTRNRLLLYSKHHPSLRIWLSTGLFFLRTLLSWSLKPRWQNNRQHRDALWQGLTDFLKKRWGIRPVKQG